MEWLAGTTGLIAAAVAVPLLVLMYFLKLRRTEMPVSSTLLWKRAVQDLQVNAPFQRLRRNLLLLLQLLILAAALLALARPVLSLRPGQARRYVLLIDRSASMNAREGAATRLELAKVEARKVVEGLRSRTGLTLQDESDQAMVVAFADRAKLMCNFTSDKAQLRRAIDRVAPTDGGTSLAEAVTVARAFAQPADDAQGTAGGPSAQLDLFSDGRIADLADLGINPGDVFYHRVGDAENNVAVVAMEARRSYVRSGEVSVFATLANYGPSAVTCPVELVLDDSVRAVRSVRVPGRKAEQTPGPGRASVSFSLSHAGSAVVGVRQRRADALGADDAAYAILPAPKKLAVLLVTRGNAPLAWALKACPLRRLDVRTPEAFDAMDHAAMAVRQPYDVIVLDGHAPAALPRCRYLVFGAPPAASGATDAGRGGGQVIVDWRDRHPVLQHLNLSNLMVSRCRRLKLPRDAVVLAEFADSPALALTHRSGSAFLLAGFDVLQSNWPFEPSFVMFCYNAVRHLGMEMGRGRRRSLKVGDAIVVRGGPPGRGVPVTAPGGGEREVVCDDRGTLRYPRTDRTGIYTVSVPGRPPERFAVNLLNEAESDVAPALDVELAGTQVPAAHAEVRRSNVELWPLLAAAALALACLEWFVYTAKLRL